MTDALNTAREALPETLPGHWETGDGLAKAREYAAWARSDLEMSERTDLALANALYLADGFLPIQTAAKERMRWLSVQLALVTAERDRLASPSVSDTVNAGLVEAARRLSDELRDEELRRHPGQTACVESDGVWIALTELRKALSAAEAPPAQTGADWTEEQVGSAWDEAWAIYAKHQGGDPGDERRGREAACRYLLATLNATPPVPALKASSEREGEEWLRDRNLIYTLEQFGWDRGGPKMRNRLMVRVEGGPGAADEEVDALIERLHTLLSERPAAGEDQKRRAVPLSTISEGWRPEDGFKIGQPVEVADGYAYQEWRRIPLFICEVKARIGSAELSYSVSENWPPKGLGDITTDFAEIDLQPRNPAPAQDAEGEG